MRFLSVELENWKNFRSVEVKLQQRVFVVGPNASGKSNFLDAFRFLQDLALPGGGLQKAVSDRGGISKLRCLAARRYPNVALRVHIGNGDETTWYYELEMNQDNQRRPLVAKEIVMEGTRTVVRRPDSADGKDRERLTQTLLEQVSANKEFREVVDFFLGLRYLHVIPQIVRNPRMAADQSRLAMFGGDFLERLARSSGKSANSRLKRVEAALRVAVPNLKELKIDRDDLGVPHLKGRYEHWRPRAGWQDESVFSDGTLRLMGLLWSVMDGNGPLLLEEPELSLHTGVVRHIPRMLAQATKKTRRQIILSTHSEDILRDPGIAPDEVLSLQPSDDGTRMTIAKDDPQVMALLQHGQTVADAVLERTAPKNVGQLSLFEPV